MLRWMIAEWLWRVFFGAPGGDRTHEYWFCRVDQHCQAFMEIHRDSEYGNVRIDTHTMG
jgi:hypothetical protein